MKYIVLPEHHERRVSFYLSVEEYLARHSSETELFMTWQVPPSVIFGRNQLIENEVNLDYCREHGIATFRRKSGGGCVYADLGNVMITYITGDESVALTYNRFMGMLVLALRSLGIEARTTGRNDVFVGDRKVSGSAFYHLQGRNIVHSTLLFDADMENMVGSITPSGEKLRSKGVESVRQHVGLLKDYTDIGIDDFCRHLRGMLCQGDLTLTPQDMQAIEQLELSYLSHDFIFGSNPSHSIVRRGRIEGVGELEARLQLKNNTIVRINLMGDFFIVGDLDVLLRALHGVPLEREALLKAVPDDLDQIIAQLQKDDFIGLLLQ